MITDLAQIETASANTKRFIDTYINRPDVKDLNSEEVEKKELEYRHDTRTMKLKVGRAAQDLKRHIEQYGKIELEILQDTLVDHLVYCYEDRVNGRSALVKKSGLEHTVALTHFARELGIGEHVLAAATEARHKQLGIGQRIV